MTRMSRVEGRASMPVRLGPRPGRAKARASAECGRHARPYSAGLWSL